METSSAYKVRRTGPQPIQKKITPVEEEVIISSPSPPRYKPRDKYPSKEPISPYVSQKYPSSRDQYPSSRDQYPSSRDQYSSSRDQYSSSRDQYPSSRDQYPSSRDQYPSSREKRYYEEEKREERRTYDRDEKKPYDKRESKRYEEKTKVPKKIPIKPVYTQKSDLSPRDISSETIVTEPIQKRKIYKFSEKDMKIIDNFLGSQIKDKYSIVQAIGDLSNFIPYSLTENKNLNKYVLFISNPVDEEFREMIKSEVTTKKQEKLSVLEEIFLYSPEIEGKYILYFFPPWLADKPDKKGLTDFWDIPINNSTVEEILYNEFKGLETKEHIPEYAFFILPKSYPLTAKKGWIINTQPLNEFYKLLLVKPSPEEKQRKEEDDEINQIIRSTRYKNPKDIDPKDDQLWRDNLKKFLKTVLIRFLRDEESVDQLLDDSVMDIWASAFTHETFDLNNNYEQLETIGDRALELPFVKLIVNQYPNVTSSQITLIKSDYMSKQFQGATAKKLGFGPWIRIAKDFPNVSILEDSFESFAGALDATAEKQLGPGFGFISIYNFLDYIFKDIDINPDLSKGKPISQIKEIFEKYGWGKGGVGEPKYSQTEGIYEAIIFYTDAAFEYLLKEKKLKADDTKVFGVGHGNTKKAATESAFKNALSNLNKMGINSATAKKYKEINDWILTGVDIQKVLDKVRSEGYETFEFFTSKTTSNLTGYLVQLVGVKYEENGKKNRTILETGRYQDILEGKKDLLQKYLKS